MIPTRIELENFLSFGTPAVVFTFTGDEPLWVLCGRNGVGKSAVFDGITYALYGEHRAGTQKAEQLIRHGANGFRVVLEFEFAGSAYRITRARAGRTTQKVERHRDGEWEAVPGVNTAAEVKAWVERTLGLGYKAFTTSVLLRQGEADKLFSASREERIAVLKGIIGFERFEAISGQVHDATLGRGRTLETLWPQRRTLEPVTPEELAAAEDAVTAAEQQREAAQAALTAAARGAEQARQWEALEKRRVGLEQQLAAAEQRATAAAAIRAAKARLDDLSAAVPQLEALFGVRDRIAALDEKSDAARKTLRVKELARDVNKERKLLLAVAAVETLEADLAKYPGDLDARIAAAVQTENQAEEASTAAAAARTRTETLLEQALKQQKQFADVRDGAVCPRCRQWVDPAHAAAERARTAEEVSVLRADLDTAGANAADAANRCATARSRRKKLEECRTVRDHVAVRLQTQREHLPALGEVATAAEVRERLAALCRRLAEEEGRPEAAPPPESPPDGKRLDAERKKLEAEVKAAEREVSEHGRQLATARGEERMTLGRLSAFWQEQLPTLDAGQVAGLAAERDRLHESGVAARFELLRQDDEKRAGWSEQLRNVRSEIDLLPADARVPAQEAERRLGDAKALADAATNARDTAVRTRDGLKARAEQYERLTVRLRAAERDHDLHKKLDDLLGQNGLQRELVRDAEQQIVGLANDTLQHLSDGDLSLEQDEEAAGRDDKAFALRARRVGDPEPTGVLFLSGSQKFRVAVSVALAVGRFARGRARPLETVIIDEGFGSLDKEGLRAMADELKRLQRSQELKRVILVSHQDEFTSQFPVGYRLTAGTDGTTAAPFRS
jgi:DNA repair exonuclease SbcCD ATPase subunit